jgi:hypothetical protein
MRKSLGELTLEHQEAPTGTQWQVVWSHATAADS